MKENDNLKVENKQENDDSMGFEDILYEVKINFIS